LDTFHFSFPTLVAQLVSNYARLTSVTHGHSFYQMKNDQWELINDQ